MSTYADWLVKTLGSKKKEPQSFLWPKDKRPLRKCVRCRYAVYRHRPWIEGWFVCHCRDYRRTGPAEWTISDRRIATVSANPGRKKVSLLIGHREHKAIAVARLMLEASIGRRLKRNEVAHHIDHNPEHDVLENLQVMTATDHARHHVWARAKA